MIPHVIPDLLLNQASAQRRFACLFGLSRHVLHLLSVVDGIVQLPDPGLARHDDALEIEHHVCR
jgi:hypothetical protein